jgi:hypothetical protein
MAVYKGVELFGEFMDDANKWQASIDEELGSCPTLGVWEKVHMPKGKQALPSFFIFEIKREWRFQARLVTGGD